MRSAVVLQFDPGEATPRKIQYFPAQSEADKLVKGLREQSKEPGVIQIYSSRGGMKEYKIKVAPFDPHAAEKRDASKAAKEAATTDGTTSPDAGAKPEKKASKKASK